MGRILFSLCISVFLSILISYYWRVQTMPYFLSITARSSTDSFSQVYFDTGGGYSENKSTTVPLNTSITFEELIFPLPKKIIRNLRFDPLATDGSLTIKYATLYGRNKANGENEILHQFDLSKFDSINEVTLSRSNSGNLIIEIPQGNLDPMLNVSLDSPLNHWEFRDFLDKEWFIQSCFLFLLFTPIIVSLTFFSDRKIKNLLSIKFSIGRDEIIIQKGENFQLPKSHKLYRDTGEDNLKSIIAEIKKGTEWRTAVNDIFSDSDPWLDDIVTSTKRFKFITEFIKPKNNSILDIGAGWGQFSIPLAKNNSVCSLEPTPERLEFIEAVAQQEGVAENIFFLGLNYFDLKFQTKFDLILSIGVLEWVGKFTSSKIAPESAQFEFLNKIKSDLSEQGKLLIGIENRLGLKYLLGSNDDHTGLPDISCFCQKISKTKFNQKTGQDLQCFTYTLEEYKKLLYETGFSEITFFAALPDYKLPDKIFPISDDFSKCELNNFINDGGKVDEHDGSNGQKLENLDEIYSMYNSLAEMNLAHYFAPSFYIIAE